MGQSKHRDDQFFAAPVTFLRTVTMEGDHNVKGDLILDGTQLVKTNLNVLGNTVLTGSTTIVIQRPSTIAGSSGGVFSADAITGSAVTIDDVRYVRRLRITLTNLVLNVLAANDFGSVKFADMPASNILILAAEVNLSLVKDGVGIVAATDVTMGIGQAAASATPLSGDEIDVLTKALTVDEDPALWKQITHDLGTPASTYVDDGAPLAALFLNAAATLTTDGSLTASGTIDFYYIDVGNVNS